MGAFPLIHLHPYAIELFLCAEIICEDLDMRRIPISHFLIRTQTAHNRHNEQRSCHHPHEHKRQWTRDQGSFDVSNYLQSKWKFPLRERVVRYRRAILTACIRLNM